MKLIDILQPIKETYRFDKLRFDKNSWYNKPQMMGHHWDKETVDELERIANKYSTTPFQKYIIYNTIDFNQTEWRNIDGLYSKKYMKQIAFCLKNSSKYTPNQLRRWLDHNEGVLKSPLTWALEYAAYVKNREEYFKDYARTVGFYGMKPDEARKRFDTYHTQKIADRIKFKEYIRG